MFNVRECVNGSSSIQQICTQSEWKGCWPNVLFNWSIICNWSIKLLHKTLTRYNSEKHSYHFRMSSGEGNGLAALFIIITVTLMTLPCECYFNNSATTDFMIDFFHRDRITMVSVILCTSIGIPVILTIN